MDTIGEVCRDAGPDAGLVRAVIEAAVDQPLLVARARIDPALAPVREQVIAAVDRLDVRARENWAEGSSRLEGACAATEGWMLLAGPEANAQFNEIKEQQASAIGSAALGEPFAVLAAAQLVATLAVEVDQLRGHVREQATAAITAGLLELQRRVTNAAPELKATTEWVDARRSETELADTLARAQQAPDADSLDLVNQIRHQLAVQEDLLDVTTLSIERRDKELARQRDYKHAEDRAMLAEALDRLPMIHIQLLLTMILACLLSWIFQMLPAAMIPAVFAWLRAHSARAMLRQRRWSIPHADVEPVEDRLTGRMIVSVLLVVGIVIEMVILWMSKNI